MFPKNTFTILAFVFTVVITTTSGSRGKTCNDQCKENWITESLESNINKYQESITDKFCEEESNVDVKRIKKALNDTLDRIVCELVTELVPASNGVAFFPILALINLLIFAVILLINLLEGGGSALANAAGFDSTALHDWYANAHSSMANLYNSSPNEINDCIVDYVDSAKCIIDDLYEALRGDSC